MVIYLRNSDASALLRILGTLVEMKEEKKAALDGVLEFSTLTPETRVTTEMEFKILKEEEKRLRDFLRCAHPSAFKLWKAVNDANPF